MKYERSWFNCRCYDEVDEGIVELLAENERQTRQIEWLVDEYAYELAENETHTACPVDPLAHERKRLAIITDMQEVE